MRTPKDLAGKFTPWAHPGFNPALLVWQAALAGGLLAAGRVYRELPPWPVAGLAGASLLLAAGLWAAGGLRGLPRLAAGGALVALLHLGLGLTSPDPAGLPGSLWFGAALALLAALSQPAIARLAELAPGTGTAEPWRWSLLAALAAWLHRPLFTAHPFGGGDATWYKLMLADFVAQVRAVGLPVWAGQTEYAFNGAVIPLRVAPWYQHAGALADWLTARSLSFIAINNLVLALNAFAAAFSAYACFRALLPRQPWSALVIAFLYAACPAVLSPLSVGDQYMTFLTAPFLPVAAYALWRIAGRDEARDYLRLAAALAALWASHPPVALCLSFFAVLTGLGRLLFRRGFRWAHAALAAGVFLCLGSLPFASALALGQSPGAAPGNDRVVELNHDNFPQAFLPLQVKLPVNDPGSLAQYYQPGYAVLGLGLLALGVFAWRRTLPAGLALAVAALCAILVLPVPGVNGFLWHHVPAAAMQVLNVWSIQRLAGSWAIFLLVAGAGSLALLESAGRRRLAAAGFAGLLVPAALWTAAQSSYVTQRLRDTTHQGDDWRSAFEPHNLILTRYAFNPFPTTPGYFSHGYINPNLEHRLLRADLTLFTSNAESAVRRGPLPAPDPGGHARLAHGTWRAVNDNHSAFYNLAPTFAPPAGEPLALWLEPLEPGQAGWLQIRGRDVFREYTLPDSGFGAVTRAQPRGFGTLPASTPIISLFTRDPHESLLGVNIAPDHTPAYTDFDFARYELWRYDPASLPVALRSWAPYHLQVNSPVPGFVETPRAWLPHYRGRVNGRYLPGQRSPDGLLMIPIPAGFSDITIKYVPPLWLELTYWLNLAGWGALALAGLTRLGRAPSAPPAG